MGSLTARHARYRPHHTAVVIAPRERTSTRSGFRGASSTPTSIAARTCSSSLGVARGDRVATVLPNSLVLLGAYWACAKLGAVVVPLSPLLTATGLASLLADASPRVVIGTSAQRLTLDEVRAGSEGDRSQVWSLVDALPSDEQAGYRALEPLIADASEGDPGIAVEPGDLWTLMYTSGTTGIPKGIQHTHFIRAMYAARGTPGA